MRSIKFVVSVAILTVACSPQVESSKQIPQFLLKFSAESFAYPVGKKEYVTEGKDRRDEWYNAQDFGENRHLGEDWNKNTGDNTDCGEPVYAAANGVVVFSGDAGPGWGNVLILDHMAEDGTKVQSLYGHMKTLTVTEGTVFRRDQVGTIGGASGRYPCHLHFEIRWSACPYWNEAGPGYADDREGWVDPSEFIDRQRDPPSTD